MTYSEDSAAHGFERPGLDELWLSQLAADVKAFRPPPDVAEDDSLLHLAAVVDADLVETERAAGPDGITIVPLAAQRLETPAGAAGSPEAGGLPVPIPEAVQALGIEPVGAAVPIHDAEGRLIGHRIVLAAADDGPARAQIFVGAVGEGPVEFDTELEALISFNNDNEIHLRWWTTLDR